MIGGMNTHRTQRASRATPTLDERVCVRLPAVMLRRVDSLALYSMSPRATALRHLLMRGLEAEEAAQ
jgi:hypothetical protein